MNQSRLLLCLVAGLLASACKNPIHLLGMRGENGRIEEASYDVPTDKYISIMRGLLDRTHKDTMVAIERFESAHATYLEKSEHSEKFKLRQIRMGITGSASAGLGDYYNISGDMGLELILRRVR